MAGILDIEAGRGAVVAATAALSGLAGSMYAVGNTELGPFFREVDDMIRLGEATRVAILAEALARGVVAASDCPSVTSWVIQWAPSFRSGGAAQLVSVAQATRTVRNGALAAAVLGARVGSGAPRWRWSRWTSCAPGCATRPWTRSGRGSSRSP